MIRLPESYSMTHQWTVLVLGFLFIELSVSQETKWQCSQRELVGVVSKHLDPVTCTVDGVGTPSISPSLPTGIDFSYTQSSPNGLTVTISGTPTVASETRSYTLSLESFQCQLSIAVAGKATYIDYGFDYVVEYAGVPIEPIPLRSDSVLSSFTSNPPFPNGVVLDESSGMISGTFPADSLGELVYTVTGRSSSCEVTTTVKFIIKTASEMKESGFSSCHWVDVMTDLPPIDYFYTHSAQLCQHETSFDLSNYVYHAFLYPWTGLDNRFYFFFASYFYGYLTVPVTGNYTFILEANDKVAMFFDSLDTPVIETKDIGLTVTKEVTLTAGPHLLVASYYDNFSPAVFILKVTSIDAGFRERVVDSSMMKVGGRGPSFVTYSSTRGSVNADFLFAPERNSGVVDMWFVAPELPSGFFFDPLTGEIRGKTRSAYDGYHTVTAVGKNGAASVRIHIVIDASPLPGLLATYSTFIENQIYSICNIPAILPRDRTLNAARVDSLIPSSPFDDLSHSIPSTSANYVEWEGYLYFTELGDWKIRLGCAGACRLWSRDRLLIDHWYNLQEEDMFFYYCDSYRTSEAELTITSVGYYHIKLLYTKGEESERILLEWLPPLYAWEVVPSYRFFHTAPSALSYEYEYAVYGRDDAIPPNSPRLSGLAFCNNYQITPSLPSDLSLDSSSGMITGTSFVVMPVTVFTVSCTSDVGVVNTTLTFSVVMPSSDSPKGVMTDNKSSTSAVRNDESSKDAVRKNDSSISSLNQESSNSPSLGAFKECKGKYENGTVWKNTMLVVRRQSGVFGITLKKNGNIVSCSFGRVDKDGYAVMSPCEKQRLDPGTNSVCVEPMDGVEITFSCSTKEGCRRQFFRSPDIYWPSQLILDPSGQLPYNQTVPYPEDVIPLTNVTLSANEITAYRGIFISPVEIYPGGCYDSIAIKPSLGSDFTMDLERPVVSGYLRGAEHTVYTITASRGKKTVRTTLQVHLKDCNEEGKTWLSMAFMANAFSGAASYELYKDSIESSHLLIRRVAEKREEVYQDTVCTEKGYYLVVMKGGDGGWREGSYLKAFNDNNRLVEAFSFDKGTGSEDEKRGNFTLTSGYAQLSWKINAHSNPGGKWASPTFDDSAWADTGLNKEHGAWTQNTVYLRYTLTIDDASFYTLVEFGVWMKDGVIAYFNGNEVARLNMPAGKAKTSTAASDSFDAFVMQPFSAPGYLLVDGKNVVALEIHKHPSTSDAIQFRGYVNPIEGDWVSRVYRGWISEPFYFNKLSESSASAWNPLTQKSWTSSSIPVWTVYSFNYGRMEWVNRLSVQKGAALFNCNPTSIRLSGSNDGLAWKELFAYQNFTFFNGSEQKREFMMMNHLDLFSKYKFEVLDSDCDRRRVSLSGLDLIATPLTYCVMSDGFPGVMPGETSTAACPSGFIGDMYRECRSGEPRPVWGKVVKECRSTNPPIGRVYVDVAFSITKESVDATKKVVSVLTTAFSTASKIREDRTELWKVKDVSSDFPKEASVSAFWIRVTAKSSEAGAVLESVSSSLHAFQVLLNTTYKMHFVEGADLQFFLKPVLRERRANWLLWSIVAVLVVIGCVGAALVWFLMKSKNGKKSVKRPTKKQSAEERVLKASFVKQ